MKATKNMIRRIFYLSIGVVILLYSYFLFPKFYALGVASISISVLRFFLKEGLENRKSTHFTSIFFIFIPLFFDVLYMALGYSLVFYLMQLGIYFILLIGKILYRT